MSVPAFGEVGRLMLDFEVRVSKGVSRAPGVKKEFLFPVRKKLSLGVKIPVEADVIKSIIRSYRQTVNICWKVDK